MKLSRAEVTVLVITAVLLAVMGGYFLGSGKTEPLAQPVSVQSVPPEEAEVSSESEAPAVTGLVDINTAGLEELMTLPGIGEKRAQAILDYREEHGPFEYVEDLIQVSGIGEGILAGLMDYATAGGTEHAEDSGS